MSDLFEKLSSPQPTSDTTARAKLAHLRARWGKLVVLEGTEKAPRLLELHAMSEPEHWRFIYKDEQGEPWFEQLRP